MLYHKIVPIAHGVYINALLLDMPFLHLDKTGWIGIPGWPTRTYTFLERGPSYGSFKIPTVTIGTELHVGFKGDMLEDRLIYEVVDLDDNQLLVRRINVKGSESGTK